MAEQRNDVPGDVTRLIALAFFALWSGRGALDRGRAGPTGAQPA